MQDHDATTPPPTIGPGERAEIVARLYDAALDPILLEHLVDAWESRIGPLRAGSPKAAGPFDDPEIEAHLRRASVFLDRFEATRSVSVYRSALDGIPRSAAFLSDGGPFRGQNHFKLEASNVWSRQQSKPRGQWI